MSLRPLFCLFLSDRLRQVLLYYQGSLKTLEEAHRLVNVNLHNAAQYKKECEEAEEKNRVTFEKLDSVEADLSNTQQSLDSLKVERDEALEEWMSKVYME